MEEKNLKKREIKFSPPDIGQLEIDNVVRVLQSGWITTGPETKKFERNIAAYCNTAKAVCLNSATACLELTLRLLGIGAGDEVVTSAYTYTASASVIDHVGAKIVMVDIGDRGLEMDYEALSRAITPKTKAIIAVDIGGIMCDYDAIFKIAESKRDLFKAANSLQKAIGRVVVIADAAHSFGATYKGQRSGAVADFTSFSFHAVKNLTTAEGGAVTWRTIEGMEDEEIYRQYMLMSLHGQSKDALAKTQLGAWEYDIVKPYFKCNMTDIMAAIGSAQLTRYDGMLKRRQEIIEQYNKSFASSPIRGLEHYNAEGKSSGHLYITQIDGIGESRRNDIIVEMARRGIACNVHYKPLPKLTAYREKGFKIEDYPKAERFFRQEITLPLHTMLSDEDVNYIAENFKEVVNGAE